MDGRPMVPRALRLRFWELIRDGKPVRAAAVGAGVSKSIGVVWFRDSGGMSPLCLDPPSGRYLSLQEREEIALGRAGGVGVREIARRIGRDPGTVSRELRRNRTLGGNDRGYRAILAASYAERRARRPKTGKLAADPRLRDVVAQMLEQRMSPEQIGGRLPLLFPDDPSMRVSHEVIYRALYVQGRGALKRELTACLRTGRVIRRPKRRVDARRSRQRITDMVMISERPPEVTDRAVPGHWEGDLIIGANGKSAIGTLVERTTRFTMLLHLPDGHSAHQLSHAITTTIGTLPTQLRRSLTWDQGIEMAHHATISIATDLDIYFCDPHSPWQRGTNENTNGLLRQYFPKGTDLSIHPPEHLTAVTTQLNARPRKTLAWRTPAEAIAPLLCQPGSVATTP